MLRVGATTRALANRIELYSPLDESSCLVYGEICLDEAKQRVFTANGVSHLPTKGIEILKHRIKHRGAEKNQLAIAF